MNILALDSSSKYFSLVIARDNKILNRVFKPYQRELSKQIIPAISRGLNKSGLSVKKIDCFGVGLGPGSFTGLRIGLAALKGMGFGLDKSLVGLGSLGIIANSLKNRDSLICPVVDAKRAMIYSAVYQWQKKALKRKSRYYLLPVKAFLKKLNQRAVFTGDAIAIYKDTIIKNMSDKAEFADERFWYPLPESLLDCAREKISAGDFLDLNSAAPIYLYPKECQMRNKEK